MNDAPLRITRWLIWALMAALLAATAWWLWPTQPHDATSTTISGPVSITNAASPPTSSAPPPAEAETEAAPVPLDQLDQLIEQQGHISITGRPIDEASLRANQKQLLDEITDQKRSINPSTMSPLMALEYEQFGRYLARGEFSKADQLLSEMQASWPDYDYEDMIYQLALAEVNAGQ